ncbi:MAG: hypothetical protein WD767_03505 [Alphaproteobacteria bacterium]
MITGRAANELDLLPDGSTIAELLADYDVARKQTRACMTAINHPRETRITDNRTSTEIPVVFAVETESSCSTRRFIIANGLHSQ